ncbi:hypothetical protein XA68_12551 [Ophiocordyceps unilateralis]|uniref:Xaa-Pro dipeptidyl-peptidase-like domain-containing protein n=1 Tax=Ophiocordyceps unilateralis TaxID=268505 RepID=A0A2A9PP73_OPHUN|nr:hypothetical protein XA68_12551 [Ophiocordyceps unilateralis]
MSLPARCSYERPQPTVCLTIPSLYDGTTLDCRLYHPVVFDMKGSSSWRGNAAVVAHPYAPMGGCYDDAVVETVVAQLLESGFLVGTFNFRGAGLSAGRTSWTARPEREDYASFVAFLAHYVDHLDAPREDASPPVLLMSGYSYGAMVTTQLGPLDTLLNALVAPTPGSYAAEIRLRAEHLALQARATTSTTKQPSPMGVRVGGDERRRSNDTRRSFSLGAENRLRRGVHDLLTRTHERGRRRLRLRSEDEKDKTKRAKSAPASTPPASSPSPRPRAAYLLVSPLQGLVSHLATFSWSLSSTAQAQLMAHPSLAIFGTRDALVPAAKVRAWAQRLAAGPGSGFGALEVAQAGHFWTEAGALAEAAAAVREFATGLVHTG